VASSNMREAIRLLNQRKPETIGKFEKKRNIADNQLVIAGTRIPVENIKAFAAQGYSVDQIKLEYPTLKEEDIRAAIDYDAAA
jgi:uncharacterized protein (DUF433 family)